MMLHALALAVLAAAQASLAQPTPSSTTTDMSTSTTTTAPVPTLPPWAQCGGINYPGLTVCPTGWVCTYLNPYHSQCLVPSTTSTTTTTAPVPTAAQYAQCGGVGWTGATACQAGWACTALNQYFFQCVPGSAP